MTKAIKRTKRKLFIASALIIFLIFSSQIFSAEILSVYFSPYNHSESAATKHDENYIIVKDIGIAHVYETQFQRLWEKHK